MPEPSLRFEPGQCVTLTSCARQQRLLVVVDPDAVRDVQARRQRARPSSKYSMLRAPGCRRAPSRPRPAARTRACGRARPCRDDGRRDRLEQLPRAGEREPRGERDADAAVRRCRGSARCSARLSSSARRPFSRRRAGASGVGLVHQALAERRADAGCRRRLDHRVGVVHGLHRQDRRRAAAQQLEAGEPRRGAERGRRVRGFHRPDAGAQPVHQAQVVGIAAEERLAEVDVRLDEAREQEAAGRRRSSMSCGVGRVRRRRTRSARRGPTRLRSPRPSVVHRQDGGVADEGRGHLFLAARLPSAC